MISIKSRLSAKDKQKVQIILSETNDVYGDFYITKENLRLYIKENPHLLFSYLNKGDKIIFGENGILLVTGFADKVAKIYDRNTNKYKEVRSRKYIKILAVNESITDKLIKYLLWEVSNYDLFVKIKKNNPVYNILLRNRFKFAGNRGSEILLCHIKYRIK